MSAPYYKLWEQIKLDEKSIENTNWKNYEEILKNTDGEILKLKRK